MRFSALGLGLGHPAPFANATFLFAWSPPCCVDLLIGIGAACTTACLRTQNPYPIAESLSLKVSGGFLLASLTASLVFIPWNKFASTRRYGYFLWALYAAFLATSITLQLV